MRGAGEAGMLGLGVLGAFLLAVGVLCVTGLAGRDPDLVVRDRGLAPVSELSLGVGAGLGGGAFFWLLD